MYTYGTNPETLLLLAWYSTLDLQALLQKDQQARPYKYPQYRETWLPVFPEDVLSGQITKALNCFQDGPYDSAFLNLVKYRLLFVDVQEVAAAIGFKDLTRASHGLFYSNDPFLGYTIEKQRAKGPANETDAFSEVMMLHLPLAEQLKHWSQTWNGSVCQGARALQAFFSAYPRLAQPYQSAPFFVRELLFMSLARMNWHTIAANVLRMEPPSCTCEGSKKADPAVEVILLEALLKTVGGSLHQVAETLPDPLRDTALFISDLCEHASDATEHARKEE